VRSNLSERSTSNDMKNTNITNHDWVDRQLASLPATDREPNIANTLAALQARQRDRLAVRRRWTFTIAATAAACVTLLALPGTRAYAQRLWDSLFLRRVEVVRVNFDDVPEALHWHLLEGGPIELPVSSIDEAEREVGFRPTLPPAGILSSAPSLGVNATLELGMMLHRAELSKALEKAGVSGVELPPNWEGASVRLELGPIVNAYYGQVNLAQCRPFMLITSPGFDTARFLEVAFRILGVEEREARRMSNSFAANPAWFWGIPRDKEVTIQEVSLRSGPGVYIETFDRHGLQVDAELIWETPDRIYYAGGNPPHLAPSRELLLAVANSIP
jgi:hypothetical protein